MKVTIAKTEIEAEETQMHFGYKPAMHDPRFGLDDGHGNIVMDADRLHQIRSTYRPAPGTKPLARPQLIAAVTPGKTFGAVRQRTDEEKGKLLAICATCPSLKDNYCLSAKCCGGKLPINTIVGITINTCPLGKFPK